MREYSPEHLSAFRRWQLHGQDLGPLTDQERAVLADEDPNFIPAIKAFNEKRAAAAPGPDPLRFAGAYEARGYRAGEIVFLDNALWVAAVPTSSPPSLDGGWEVLCKSGQAL